MAGQVPGRNPLAPAFCQQALSRARPAQEGEGVTSHTWQVCGWRRPQVEIRRTQQERGGMGPPAVCCLAGAWSFVLQVIYLQGWGLTSPEVTFQS